MAERDRLFAKHPNTTFIAAHFGFHANDLDRLGQLLDRLPNVYTETGAIIEELARQPRAARAFFVKYQDRILFGKDTYEASEYPAFFRRSRPPTSTSTATATTTRSGSSTAWTCRTGPSQALLRQRAQAGPRPAGRGLSTAPVDRSTWTRRLQLCADCDRSHLSF